MNNFIDDMLLIILLLGLQSETLSFDLDASTRYQIKQLHGK